MSETATYLYCLLRHPGPPALEPAPAGLPGTSPPRALDLGDGLWLVAADAPLPAYGAETIQTRLQDLSWVSECAMAHEAVVELCSEAGTVVPMKLFTLFASEERAREHVLADRGQLDRVLDRIAGAVEWGVRIRLDEAKAREAAALEARRQAAGDGVGGNPSGTSFLLRKKLEQDAVRAAAAQSGQLRPEMDAVFAELAAQSAEARRREPVEPEAGPRLLLDAAFLVPAGRREAFEAAVQRCAERLSTCEVTLTGPWPPYHFIAEEP